MREIDMLFEMALLEKNNKILKKLVPARINKMNMVTLAEMLDFAETKASHDWLLKMNDCINQFMEHKDINDFQTESGLFDE